MSLVWLWLLLVLSWLSAATVTALVLWISRKGACMPEGKCVVIIATCDILDVERWGTG